MERMTKQRLAILECFRKNCPLSIEELEKEVSKTIKGISLSTIYRNLRVLMQNAMIRKIQIPGTSEPRYELVHSHHRHHFLCITCDRLYDLEGCPEGILGMIPEGFQMMEHSITLKGLCKSCV